MWGVLLASLAACGPGPVNLGDSPDVLWWTDHETGDEADWLRESDGMEGFRYTDGGGQLAIVAGTSRSGRYALRSTVVSNAGPPLSAAIAQRSGLPPVNAHYSAWYFVTAPAAATNYWLCFKFRSRRVATDSATAVEAWDIDFVSGGAGGMQFALFGHAAQTNEEPLAMPTVPIGRWFQIETFLRATADDTGQLTVWVDGTKLFDVQARPTMPSAYVEWQVGGITQMITPNSATLFVDDAAISTRRLGPDYPIFWRGD